MGKWWTWRVRLHSPTDMGHVGDSIPPWLETTQKTHTHTHEERSTRCSHGHDEVEGRGKHRRCSWSQNGTGQRTPACRPGSVSSSTACRARCRTSASPRAARGGWPGTVEPRLACQQKTSRGTGEERARSKGVNPERCNLPPASSAGHGNASAKEHRHQQEHPPTTRPTADKMPHKAHVVEGSEVQTRGPATPSHGVMKVTATNQSINRNQRTKRNDKKRLKRLAIWGTESVLELAGVQRPERQPEVGPVVGRVRLWWRFQRKDYLVSDSAGRRFGRTGHGARTGGHLKGCG